MCSTVYGDEICRGCRRLSHEVVRWNGFSTDEKLKVIDRLGGLIEVVMAGKVDRVDLDLLESSLKHLSIRYYPQHPPITWVYGLMRTRAQKGEEVQDLEVYGVFFKPDYQSVSLLSLLSEVDEALYEKSQVASTE
jgi:predicted Fe-S protein YdhL (DUF1289 family)